VFKGLIIKNGLSLSVLLLCTSTYVQASFLKMPEIEELREIKEQTLLRDMDIPAVRDRALDPTAGPRLGVSEFRIQGLVEFPELGITRQAINDLVESIRSDLMGEGKLLQSGYSLEELAEISDLLVDIEEETINRHVTELEVQKLIWLIRTQQGKRGVTLGQIEGIANSITQFYRERGFILAKAYIPKQEVRDGIVNLTVLLGMLGEVEIANNEMYNTDYLKSIFKDDLAKPVTNQTIEERLYEINGFPGIQVDGFFEPGKQVGDTKLNVNIRQEDRFSYIARMDNHGSEDSGLYRLLFGVKANNLLGFADYLNINFLQTAFPDDTTYWQLKYDTTFFTPVLRFGVDYSQNDFLVNQSSIASNIDLSGLVAIYGAQFKYIAQQSRKKNSSYELRFENIISDLQVGTSTSDFYNDAISIASISYSFDRLDDAAKQLHNFKINYDFGNFDYGYEIGQDEKFNILNIDYSLLSFVKVPFFEANSRLVVRLNTQFSGTNLSSVARFSLTGASKARGFEPGYFTADDAAYVGAEWIFNSPDMFDITIEEFDLTNAIRPFLFADYAYGYQYSLNPLEDDATAHIADIGLGLQVSHRSGLSGNFQLAFPVLSELENAGEDPDYDSFRLNVDIQYAF